MLRVSRVKMSDKANYKSGLNGERSPPTPPVSQVGSDREDGSEIVGGGRTHGFMTDESWRALAEENKKLREKVAELQEEKKRREEAELNLEKLVDVITQTHGDFGEVIHQILGIARKDPVMLNILNLGPFEDEKDREAFLANLTSLAEELHNDFENLDKTRTFAERINQILKLSTQNYQGPALDGQLGPLVSQVGINYPQIEPGQGDSSGEMTPDSDNEDEDVEVVDPLDYPDVDFLSHPGSDDSDDDDVICLDD